VIGKGASKGAPFLVVIMPYRMRDNLSYCVVNGHAIFLDAEADRYFCLPEHIERSFIAYATACDRSDPILQTLAAHNILTPEQDTDRDSAQRHVSHPLRSAREMWDERSHCTPLMVLEVAAIVCACRWQIGALSFKTVLDRTTRYRALRCLPQPQPDGLANETQILQLTSLFRRARMYIPIANCCLLDSLALSRFLARRHFRANIVFGVTYDPFSAHCWVQSGDIALNETVGNAMAHTIIKVM